MTGLQKGAARFGQILPGRLRAKFGQILPGACPAKFGQVEPRISHRIRRAARFGQILPGACPAKFGQIEPRPSGGPKLFNFKMLNILKVFGKSLSKKLMDFKDFKGVLEAQGHRATV